MTTDVLDETAMLEHVSDQRSSGGPAWRWNRAGEEIHKRPDEFLRQLGQEFLEVHHYRTLCDHSPVGVKQALAIYPHINAAEELNADVWKTTQLKIAVLGEIDLKEFSPRFGIDESVLSTWEKVFYDIRGFRSATGWIQIYVIQPELAEGRADLAARLRMVSAVGTIAARAILKADTRPPIQEGQKLFQRQLKLHLKSDAAMSMTADTQESRLFFMRQHGMLMREEKHLQFAREKLEKKCAEALDRHKLATIRAEIALERERTRAARQARRAEGAALEKRGEKESRQQLAARQRQQEQAEQAAIAARIAASPLLQLRWRDRQGPGKIVSGPAQAESAQFNMPLVIASATVPFAVILPRNGAPVSAGVPV